MDIINIDLTGHNFSGDVIDISLQGSTVMSDIINLLPKTSPVEKDFLSLDKDGIKANKAFYDHATAFFAFNSLRGRKKFDSIIKEIKTVLRVGGKIKLWDVITPKYSLLNRFEINISIGENKITTLNLNTYLNFLRLEPEKIISILSENGFVVLKNEINGKAYYIEAFKKGEKKHEDSTRSAKFEVCTQQPGDKVSEDLCEGL